VGQRKARPAQNARTDPEAGVRRQALVLDLLLFWHAAVVTGGRATRRAGSGGRKRREGRDEGGRSEERERRRGRTARRTHAPSPSRSSATAAVLLHVGRYLDIIRLYRYTSLTAFSLLSAPIGLCCLFLHHQHRLFFHSTASPSVSRTNGLGRRRGRGRDVMRFDIPVCIFSIRARTVRPASKWVSRCLPGIVEPVSASA
jgi:hypothetical protein